MSAYVGIQPISSLPNKPELPTATFQPMPMPRFETQTGLSSAQVEVLNQVKRDIRATSLIQPIHIMIGRTYESITAKNPAHEIITELAPLPSANVPLAVKAFVAGAGLTAASLFATSNIFASPDNKFGGILIGIIAFLTLPIIDAEFTNRRLRKEFELIPLESDHLPSLKTILDKGCTAEQFGNFAEHDLLPRVPIGHFRSMANESGTCLHDILCWARDTLHFSGTTWEMVHKVIENLGVGEDISLRVKAALLVIERDTTLNESSLAEINAELAALATTLDP